MVLSEVGKFEEPTLYVIQLNKEIKLLREEHLALKIKLENRDYIE